MKRNEMLIEMLEQLLRWFPNIKEQTILEYMSIGLEKGVEDATIIAEWIESVFDTLAVGFEPIILKGDC